MLRSMDKPHGDLGQLMDIIVEEVDRLDVLITDFLVFASPSVGTVERAEVDVGCLLEEVCRKSPFNDKVSLEVRSSSLVIVGHEFQLERVFRNLLQNAVEADDKGLGVRIEAWKDDDSVSVKFEDHGVGISDMYRDEVFRPFFSTKPRGMGLGLSICQRIVEEHGGKIYLESRTGEGTVVTVLLPRGDGCA
jgi:signal transduction histidine kinase